jgi:hypothetical protein
MTIPIIHLGWNNFNGQAILGELGLKVDEK